MNSRAPLTLRVNPLKTTKHEVSILLIQLVEKLEKKLKLRLQKCEYAPFGFKIVAPKNINLLETDEFEQGCF
jgi:16S rRNA C967 or C1407 C5-methylase (RsmB/RsmF family)